MQTAFSYIRFSSKPQELGDSLKRQVRLAREYAAKHDLFLDERSYQDLGVSAWKGKNAAEGALGAFLKAVDEGIIPSGSYLLVESLDRVSRAEVMDALDTFMSIIKRGIALVTLQDEQVYTKATIGENWTKLIMALAVMARANEESVTKSKRIKSAWLTKRDSGEIMTSRGPAWLELNANRKKWDLLPDKVATVRQIFEWGASGLGCPTIANKLNEAGTPTQREAAFWEPALVMAVLKNRAALGELVSRTGAVAPVEGYYPQIIKPEIFHIVQEHIAKRRHTGGPKGTNVANLFSGLTYCECGTKTRFVSSDKRKTYLRCLRAYSNVGCDAPPIPYSAIEDEIVRRVLSDGKVPLDRETLHDPMVLIRGEITDKRKLLDKMIEALGMTEGAASLPTLVNNMTRLEVEIAGLEKQLKKANVPVPISQAHKSLMLTWKFHEGLKKTGGPEFIELRLRLQAELKRLVSKIVLRKSFVVRDLGDGFTPEVGQLVLYGPFFEATRSKWESPFDTPDGGLLMEYQLPAWGFKGTRRREQNPPPPIDGR